MQMRRFVAIYAVVALVALLSLLIAPSVFGATTISTSIVTGGNLTVTGNATVDGTLTIGGSVTIDGAAASTYSIGGSVTSGTITIGGASQTGTITLGRSTASNTINIGNADPDAAATQIINIGAGAGNGNTATDATIGIGNGSGTSTVIIGSHQGASALTLQGGTGNVTVNVGGTNRLVITPTTQAVTITGTTTLAGSTSVTTGPFTVPVGSVAAPSITFSGDTDTGLFNTAGGGGVSFAVDGITRLAVGTSTQNVTITGSTSVSGTVVIAAGTVSAPSIALSGDTDTGIAAGAVANNLTLVAGGYSPFAIGSSTTLSTVTITGTATVSGNVRAGDGLVGNPAFSFDADPDTGIFRSAANTLQLVAGGYNPIQLGTSSSILSNVTINGTTTAGNILAGNGVVGNPAYSFSNDPDTGVFRSAGNTLQLVAGGYNPIQIGSSSSTLSNVTINGTTTSGSILANDGVVGNPAFSFSADSDTGIFRSGTNGLQLVAGGKGSLLIGSSTNDLVGVTVSGSTSITGNLTGGTVATNGSTTLDIAGALTTIALCHGNADLDDEPIVDCSGAPSDIAEYYETTNGVEAGDIVATTQNFITYKSVGMKGDGEVVPGKNETLSVLAKSSTPYQSNVIGIVSTAPYQLFGEDVKEASKHPMPIALAGRVPVKVTNENGAIRAGDWLAASSKPGYAMKATGAGYVAGIALANFDGQNGKILALVKPGYIGASQFQGGESSSIQATSPAASLETVEKLVVQGNARFGGQIIVGKDTAGNVSVKAGQKTARVDFGTAYKKVPVITVTPLGNPGGYFWISDVSEKGFTVNVSKALSGDLGFNWIALGSNQGLGEKEAKAKVETAAAGATQ